MILLSGLINYIDTAVLIPESIRIREKEGDAAARGFLNFFLAIYAMIGVLFVLLMMFFGTSFFNTISKFSIFDIERYESYFLIGSFYFFFQVLSSFLSSILNSLKIFSLPIVLSSINTCIAIVGIFLLHRDYDVLSILIGGVAGWCSNFLLLVIILKKNGWKFLHFRTTVRRPVWSNVIIAESGQTVLTASSFIPLYLLSGLGSGIISAMNYGKNIADIPGTLLTSQTANITGIKFNEQLAQNDQLSVSSTFSRITRLLIFITVPVACFMFIFAEHIVRLFYDHGDFKSGDIVTSVRFLQLFSIVIFTIAVNAIVSRLFIAAQAIRQGIGYSVFMNLLQIIAIWTFVKYFGAYGYPYAVILINFLNFFMLYFILKKYFPYIRYGKLLNFCIPVFVINVIFSAGLYFTMISIHFHYLSELLLGFVLYLAAATLYAMKSNFNSEARAALSMLKATVKKTLPKDSNESGS
jgi:putative peptidoglycan lipid II flippase